MKISVIIAAYNSEEFVVETIESILNQTIDDFEIIAVNDGSTDNTLQILNGYAEKYENFLVIDKENGGPASARNLGIDIARGDYIFFFDADDILEFDALEELYNTAVKRKADLVIAKFDVFNKYKTIPIKTVDDLVTKKYIDKYEPLILWNYTLSSKLFKREIIKKYNLKLKNITYSEDGEFMLRFVYHSDRIAGLDKVIFHYRKLTFGEYGSITSYIDYKKINDFITAHNLILKSAEKSVLRDYKKYSSIEEAKADNKKVSQYFYEIVKKELQMLLNQFYPKFWNMDEETIKLICDEINRKIGLIDMKSLSELIEMHSDICLFNIHSKKKNIVDYACITAVLYAEKSQWHGFLECLDSLRIQSLINIKIVVPEYMKDSVINNGFYQENIVFSECESKDDFYKNQLNKASTDYIIFCEPKVIYYTNAFRSAYRIFLKDFPDVISNLIYHYDFGEFEPVTLNKIAFDEMVGGVKKCKQLYADRTLTNKFFNVEFLKHCLKDSDKPIIDQLEDICLSGYCLFSESESVVFNDKNENFIEFVATKESKPLLKDYLKDIDCDLNSSNMKIKRVIAFSKLLKLKNENLKNILKNITIHLYKNKKIKDRVLFYSNRTHKKLAGNSKAVYSKVKCKKIIEARTHYNIFNELLMISRIMTSKVIVTDDYVRYLRYIPVKPEQRVIQLWHACGAFKKFGQRGTNMSVKNDLATHAQYSLVSVSSDYVRSIYSDALDVSINKVRALGCPSTDKFLNKKSINKISNRIYAKYPKFKDKQIIIYAPTFRDTGKGRSEFIPNIDFEKLARELLPNQLLIICPHPVMKNKIVDKDYENIKVVRDFSTDNLMMISDMLITDYSSVIFQYSLLNKPMVFYCYDLDSYSRDFYLNYPNDLPGEVLKTQSELTDFITDQKNFCITDKNKMFFDKYMSACDGKSSKRIADLINSYIEQK